MLVGEVNESDLRMATSSSQHNWHFSGWGSLFASMNTRSESKGSLSSLEGITILRRRSFFLSRFSRKVYQF